MSILSSYSYMSSSYVQLQIAQDRYCYHHRCVIIIIIIINILIIVTKLRQTTLHYDYCWSTSTCLLDHVRPQQKIYTRVGKNLVFGKKFLGFRFLGFKVFFRF